VHVVTDTRARLHYYLLSCLYGCLFDLGRLCIFKPGPNQSLICVCGRTTYLPSSTIDLRSKCTYIHVGVVLQVGGLCVESSQNYRRCFRCCIHRTKCQKSKIKNLTNNQDDTVALHIQRTLDRRSDVFHCRAHARVQSSMPPPPIRSGPMRRPAGRDFADTD
jgi:hypothetical protein